MIRRDIGKLFEARKGHLDYRAKRDFVRNGIATIPCRISDYNDVINSYSVKGCETLNTEFLDYVKITAEVTPPECPIVLNIIGDCFTEAQKNTIEEIISDDFAYDLGMVEKAEKRHIKIFNFMFFGLLISGVLLALSVGLADIPREIFYIMFWFMGDTLCDYIFLTGHDIRRERRLAGRLASIKVIFSDSYEAADFSESDVERLYSEIEKDVNETIQQEDEDEE